ARLTDTPAHPQGGTRCRCRGLGCEDRPGSPPGPWRPPCFPARRPDMKPRHRRSLLSGIAFVSAGALLAPTAATALPAQDAPVAPAATADLIISEYIEGSSNNKALEIYN